ncbi:MAG TPA: hypothetical protein DCS93_27580 [Microscillaceae bacterium]|nr:hypothetical protein [Microscillaceae bacterium]
MKKTPYILLLPLVLLFFGSCLEEIDDFEFNKTSRITINALVTNKKGPYTVHVSKSSNNIQDFNQKDRRILPAYFKHFGNSSSLSNTALTGPPYEPVTQAIVTLSDDQGNEEILEPWQGSLPPSQQEYWPTYQTFADLGFYRTRQFQGIPGRTYILTVQYEGQVYQATATMPLPAPAIDEMTLEDKLVPFTMGHNTYQVPTISFQEPQDQKNAYLFFGRILYNDERRLFFPHESDFWTSIAESFVVIDDQLLQPSVVDLRFEIPNLVILRDNRFLLEMHTLTPPALAYYQALKNQDKNLGGVFNSAPASPPSNFSNGALGFFRVSSVSSIITTKK